jgi:hypothetical protein
MTKFKVGQVWLSRCDAEWEIVSVNITKAPYPVMARKKKSGSLATFTANGYLYEQEFESVCDLITLIKDTEETMETKFKVGDRVSRSVGCDVLGVIEHIRDGREYPYVVKCTDGSRGVYMGSELVPVKEETVNDLERKEFIARFNHSTNLNKLSDSKETVSKLPPEPVPGHYYRTREGNKLMFVGKTLKNKYLYDSKKDGLWVFDTRTTVNKDSPFRCDIVGEWVDSPESQVLPAMEIKRWAVVQVMDKRVEYGYAGGHTDEGFDDIKRGPVLKINSDINYLKRNLKDGEEIVELTGTLPAREGL